VLHFSLSALIIKGKDKIGVTSYIKEKERLSPQVIPTGSISSNHLRKNREKTRQPECSPYKSRAEKKENPDVTLSLLAREISHIRRVLLGD